ncbi:hypothetical protein WJX74_001846 [Apatococcus lobatus]|uniref:Carrier domain-containing protein n=1 Tax=Apatococcus lobatus TaxID=904363 RepID=A0AAW1S1R3_9CHLO
MGNALALASDCFMLVVVRGVYVDTNALPRPDWDAMASGDEYVAPQGQLEEQVHEVWTSELNLPRISTRTNFFKAGGTSLLAGVVAFQLSKALDTSVPATAVFGHPTIATLAANLSDKPQRAGISQAPYSVEEKAQGVPCSLSQEQMMLVSMQDGGIAYNQSFSFKLRQDVDAGVLDQALKVLVDRHESLRTAFRMGRKGIEQMIAPSAADCNFQLEVRTGPEADAEPSAVAAEHERHALKPFDLAKAPLMTAILFQGHDQNVLALRTHHSIMDGSSLQVLTQDLEAAYIRLDEHKMHLNRLQEFPPLKVQTSDFAHWQREQQKEGAWNSHMDYWKQQLSGAPEALDLPTDSARPSTRSGQGHWLPMHLDAASTKQLKGLSTQHGTSMLAVVIAAFQVVLARWCRQDDVVVGVPYNGRDLPELQHLVGNFINMLPLRTRLPSNNASLGAVLQDVQRSLTEALDHAELPFGKMVEGLGAPRSATRTPIFQAIVSMNDRLEGSRNDFVLGSVEPKGRESGPVVTDVVLELNERGEELRGIFQCSSDIFTKASAQRLASSFQVLLAAAVADPQQDIRKLPLLQQQEMTAILERFNPPAADIVPATLLHQLFEAQADRQPHATCIRTPQENLNYGQVEKRANGLASLLTSKGIRADVPVGVMLERGSALYVAVLASLPPFLAFPWPCNTASDKLFTGRPKGVPVPHCGIVNNLQHTQEVCGFTTEDIFLQRTSISFDVAVLDTFLPLQAGGCIVPVESEANKDARSLLKQLKDSCISVVAGVPSQIQTWVAAGLSASTAPSLRWLLTGAEALPIQMMRTVQERLPEISLFFGYGPTEASEHVTCKAFKDLGSKPVEVPILVGPPIPHTHIYIVDAQRQLVPVGVPGELLTSGVGLARGYLNRPDLSEQAFVPNTLAKKAEGYFSRMYSTGDLAKWSEDGEVQILGRVDRQVKVRGMRVELGEIENVLSGCEGVTGAAVRVVQHPSTKQTCIVGYLSPALQNQTSMLSTCKKRLPEHMVPIATVDMDALPTLPNGKVDHKALPDPDWESLAEGEEYIAPRNKAEMAVAAAWRAVLGLDRIGVHTNFFSAGGTSLLAGMIAYEIGSSLKSGASVALLFKHPTIAELAEALEGENASSNGTIPRASFSPEQKASFSWHTTA